MNIITLTGHLVKNATIHNTDDGREWLSFPLANNSVFYNKKQEKVEKVLFIDIVASKSNLVTYCKKGALKGAFCVVCGRLEIVNTKKDNVSYTNVKIVADELQISNKPVDNTDSETSSDHPFND